MGKSEPAGFFYEALPFLPHQSGGRRRRRRSQMLLCRVPKGSAHVTARELQSPACWGVFMCHPHSAPGPARNPCSAVLTRCRLPPSTRPPALSSHGLLPSPDAQSCPWSFSPAAAWVKRVLTRARPTPGGESCVCCFFLKPPKWPIQMSGLSPARKPAPSTLFREHASFPALPTDRPSASC